MSAQKLPIGVQSFQSLRESGYLYVDKTPYIEQLLRGKVYFLSRPRRFGKSLFLSTLAAYFRGQKELFKGLYLEKAEEELAQQEGREAWQEYTVLYLDLNTEYYRSEKDLDNILNIHLTAWEELYGKNEIEQTHSSRFKGIIERAYKKEQREVVILVDEYDKPLYETLDNEVLNATYRGILKGVFSVIKSSDEYLRFAFLTGITKFSKVSVFSGLNNLEDLSMTTNMRASVELPSKNWKPIFPPIFVFWRRRKSFRMMKRKSSSRKITTAIVLPQRAKRFTTHLVSSIF